MIRRRNRLSSDIIYPGQRLKVVPGIGNVQHTVRGQSIGLPYDGSLTRGVQLPAGRGYHRRRPHRPGGQPMLSATSSEPFGLRANAIPDFTKSP